LPVSLAELCVCTRILLEVARGSALLEGFYTVRC
jgi:hypothetical protein